MRLARAFAWAGVLVAVAASASGAPPQKARPNSAPACPVSNVSLLKAGLAFQVGSCRYTWTAGPAEDGAERLLGTDGDGMDTREIFVWTVKARACSESVSAWTESGYRPTAIPELTFDRGKYLWYSNGETILGCVENPQATYILRFLDGGNREVSETLRALVHEVYSAYVAPDPTSMQLVSEPRALELPASKLTLTLGATVSCWVVTADGVDAVHCVHPERGSWEAVRTKPLGTGKSCKDLVRDWPENNSRARQNAQWFGAYKHPKLPSIWFWSGGAGFVAKWCVEGPGRDAFAVWTGVSMEDEAMARAVFDAIANASQAPPTWRTLDLPTARRALRVPNRSSGLAWTVSTQQGRDVIEADDGKGGPRARITIMPFGTNTCAAAEALVNLMVEQGEARVLIGPAFFPFLPSAKPAVWFRADSPDRIEGCVGNQKASYLVSMASQNIALAVPLVQTFIEDLYVEGRLAEAREK